MYKSNKHTTTKQQHSSCQPPGTSGKIPRTLALLAATQERLSPAGSFPSTPSSCPPGAPLKPCPCCPLPLTSSTVRQPGRGQPWAVGSRQRGPRASMPQPGESSVPLPPPALPALGRLPGTAAHSQPWLLLLCPAACLPACLPAYTGPLRLGGPTKAIQSKQPTLLPALRGAGARPPSSCLHLPIIRCFSQTLGLGALGRSCRRAVMCHGPETFHDFRRARRCPARAQLQSLLFHTLKKTDILSPFCTSAYICHTGLGPHSLAAQRHSL